mmetsp:Transcript_4538/g.9268  ORF Transcript_4538/g.9268 Transcript_4538/m.9268 type:complete len:230 (-) Transcript_4538:1047-1736(-)
MFITIDCSTFAGNRTETLSKLESSFCSKSFFSLTYTTSGGLAGFIAEIHDAAVDGLDVLVSVLLQLADSSGWSGAAAGCGGSRAEVWAGVAASVRGVSLGRGDSHTLGTPCSLADARACPMYLASRSLSSFCISCLASASRAANSFSITSLPSVSSRSSDSRWISSRCHMPCSRMACLEISFSSSTFSRALTASALAAASSASRSATSFARRACRSSAAAFNSSNLPLI